MGLRAGRVVTEVAVLAGYGPPQPSRVVLLAAFSYSQGKIYVTMALGNEETTRSRHGPHGARPVPYRAFFPARYPLGGSLDHLLLAPRSLIPLFMDLVASTITIEVALPMPVFGPYGQSFPGEPVAGETPASLVAAAHAGVALGAGS